MWMQMEPGCQVWSFFWHNTTICTCTVSHHFNFHEACHKICMYQIYKVLACIYFNLYWISDRHGFNTQGVLSTMSQGVDLFCFIMSSLVQSCISSIGNLVDRAFRVQTFFVRTIPRVKFVSTVWQSSLHSWPLTFFEISKGSLSLNFWRVPYEVLLLWCSYHISNFAAGFVWSSSN
jgi:hypothetical protein